MSLQRRVLLAAIVWLGTVTLLHLWLNTSAFEKRTVSTAQTGQQFRVGFLPVT